ncbi:MAG: hypothetical protein ACOX2F_03565 [bacterium]
MSFLKNNSAKYLVAYLFFLSVTTGRFFFEAHHANLVDHQNLIFHHHYWYLFVFLLFLINFKLFLGLHPSKTWWVAFCSPAILIPLIYNMIFKGGGTVKFNYISAVDFPNYIKEIFTFMFFSKDNKPISVELIIITLSIFFFSWFISKKPLKSLLCALSCYLSLMIFGGTVIIAPHEPEYVLFFVNSSLKLQNFMSFVYSSASFVAAVILFSKEITSFFKDKTRFKSLIILFICLFSLFQLVLKNPFIADRIIVAFHAAFFSMVISAFIFIRKNLPLKALLLIVAVVSSGILFNVFASPSIEQNFKKRERRSDLNIQIEQKIESGINFLSLKQQRNGEFASFSCSSPDKKECFPHKGSIFISTFILYSLNFVKDNATARTIIKKGTDYIKSKREKGDLWRFWGDKIDHDLDDTSCASFILELDKEPLFNKSTIYSNRNQEGLFKTWIREREKNDVDGVVNTNVLLYLGEDKMTIPACNALVNAVIEEREREINYYYPEIAVFYYTLSRAYFEKQLKCVEKGIPVIVKKIENMLNSKEFENDAMVKAMLLNGLLNFKKWSKTMDASAKMFLKIDFSSSSLVKSPFFVAGEPPDKPSFYYFSNETAVALVVEFLKRYLDLKQDYR